MKSVPKKKTIAGMECLGRELTAEYIGCSIPKLDSFVNEVIEKGFSI